MKYYLVEYGYDKNRICNRWKCKTYNEVINTFEYFKHTYDYVVVWEMEGFYYNKIIDEYNNIDFDD